MASPWWKGDPSPSVLFKDAEAFERAVNKNGRGPQHKNQGTPREQEKDERIARRAQRIVELRAREALEANVIDGTATAIEADS